MTRTSPLKSPDSLDVPAGEVGALLAPADRLAAGASLLPLLPFLSGEIVIISDKCSLGIFNYSVVLTLQST